MEGKRIFLFGGMILALLAMTSACGGETTPAALQEVVGGVRIRAEGNSLFLTSEALQQDVVRRVAQIDGVARTDSYLVVDSAPNPIVGVSPGSPLRIKGESVSLASGEGFSPDDDAVTIPGTRVNANPYGFGMAGSLMAHRFQIGQTFELQGERLRVVGLYRAERKELESYLMLPLSTAQRLHGMEGVVTTVVVSVDPPEKLEETQRAVQQILEEELSMGRPREATQEGAGVTTPTPTGIAAPTAVVARVPSLTPGLKTVTATPRATPTPTAEPMVHETPQEGAGVATPTPTKTATPTPTSEPTKTPTPEVGFPPAQGLTISTKGTLIRIAPSASPYFTLEDGLLEKLKSLPHIASVERYLVIELGPMESTDAVIGVEPGAPLRIVRGGEEAMAKVYTGEDFTGADADASLAIAGRVRSLRDQGMGGMVHEFLVGQSFTIFPYPGRIRVIGKYRSDLESQDFNVFLPIETAQKAFGKEGEISHLFITVDSPDSMKQVEENLGSLLLGR